MTNRVQIIQGGQYGSEAKGAVAAYFAVKDQIDYAVRTGATNAGHTVYHPDTGEKFVMQQLPVGWVNPSTQLIIGAGALVDPNVLSRELADIMERTGEDLRQRLMVDYRAFLHLPKHASISAISDRHRLIGATGKGCSEALIARLRLRGQENLTLGAQPDTVEFLGVTLGDTEALLNRAWDQGAKIQLEGTQGQLLDLCLGPYPYTTHKQTGPAQWMLEAGLSPALPTDIVMVVRTYPIRVAGNSGPLPQEISWPYLARKINSRRLEHDLPFIVDELAVVAFEMAALRVGMKMDLPLGSTGLDQHAWSPEDRVVYRDALSNLNARAMQDLSEETRAELSKLFEMTTVTKKLRRVAELDWESLAVSARQIRPSRVVVTFLNYLYPERWETSDPVVDVEEREFLMRVSRTCDAPIVLVNRGPLPYHFVETWIQ